MKAWLEENGKTDEDNLKTFSKVQSGDIDDYELIASLSFLASLLKRYQRKKVFLLIDEYDKYVNNLLNR